MPDQSKRHVEVTISNDMPICQKNYDASESSRLPFICSSSCFDKYIIMNKDDSVF